MLETPLIKRFSDLVDNPAYTITGLEICRLIPNKNMLETGLIFVYFIFDKYIIKFGI